MANVGEKRPPADPSPEDAPSAPKRPAPSFNFRPSPLQQATRGFALKPSTLPSTTSPGEGHKDDDASSKSAATPLQGGFLKLDSDELKPISMSLGAPSSSSAFRGNSSGDSPHEENSGNRNQVNHTSTAAEGSNNLFLQFVPPTSSANSFSSVSSANSTSAMSTRNIEGATPTTTEESSRGGAEGRAEAVQDPPNGEEFSGSSIVGFHGATAIFPEVHTVTGEEKEKKIVQIPARLYAFDVPTHTWKERGRGEVRLNDAAQSEGLFQSRLVMRTAGSYRLLLNTHLWAQMKCERANQKSVRVTAQHGEEVAVFLIMGATKDIQQLFTAVDRRIEALRRNLNTDAERDGPSLDKSTAEVPFDDDDKESFLDELHSSPDSSPDRQVNSRTRLVPTTVKTVGIPSEEGRKESANLEVRAGEGEATDDEATKPGPGGRDAREGVASDKESTTATPPSSRSPSLGASTTTISSSDNAPDTQ